MTGTEELDRELRAVNWVNYRMRQDDLRRLGQKAADALTSQRERIRVLEEHLQQLCYKPGEHRGFEHIDYCRWCHYARDHAHHPDCVMAALAARPSAPAGGSKKTDTQTGM